VVLGFGGEYRGRVPHRAWLCGEKARRRLASRRSPVRIRSPRKLARGLSVDPAEPVRGLESLGG